MLLVCWFIQDYKLSDGPHGILKCALYKQSNLRTYLHPFQPGDPLLPPYWAGVQVTKAGCSTPTKYILIPQKWLQHAPGPLFAHPLPYQKA